MESYKLQYVSDIHLEKIAAPPPHLLLEPLAPDLALCGDIGNPFSQIYADFLLWCSKRWARVFLIAGNHEYYTDRQEKKTIEQIDNHIAALCKKTANNIFFLQKSIYFIEEYKIAIVGATLWSAPDIRHWDKLTEKGEYNAIYKHDGDCYSLLQPSDVIDKHLEHKAFLEKELGPYNSNIPKDYRVIVLTHYMPTQHLLTDDFKENPLRTTYTSDLDNLMKEPVVAWLCGHSHSPKTIRFPSGTLVSLNPLGYKTQDKNQFSRTAHITVYRENIAIRRD
jgi:predicted phosphohydrolase